MEFGEKLLLLLQEKEISQKDFSAMLNIAPTTLNGYIKNKRQPDIKLIRSIASKLNVSTDYLLDYNENGIKLNAQELSAVMKLRTLDPSQQRIILDLINIAAKRAEEEKNFKQNSN